MKRASVAELKARLSEYLAAAKRGEDVIVTDRGRPVARLTGLEGAGHWEGRAEEMMRAGLLRPPRRKLPRDFLKAQLPPDPEGRLSQAIRQEREESW
ncbi:MAG: type II toxin-antitoxin system Phd/YefM family antitoxin [Longimicrobiales bacterium]